MGKLTKTLKCDLDLGSNHTDLAQLLPHDGGHFSQVILNEKVKDRTSCFIKFDLGL